jgi:hypothetical protein
MNDLKCKEINSNAKKYMERFINENQMKQFYKDFINEL